MQALRKIRSHPKTETKNEPRSNRNKQNFISLWIDYSLNGPLNMFKSQRTPEMPEIGLKRITDKNMFKNKYREASSHVHFSEAVDTFVKTYS